MCAEMGFSQVYDTTSGEVGIFAPFTLQNVYSLFVTLSSDFKPVQRWTRSKLIISSNMFLFFMLQSLINLTELSLLFFFGHKNMMVKHLQK